MTLVFALALQLAAAQPIIVQQGPPSAPFAAHTAVAHVATYEERMDGRRPHRIVLTRNGEWLRQQEQGQADASGIYSNFRTNFSIMLNASASRPTYLQADQLAPGERYGRFEVTPTGASERILGERCTVRRWRRVTSEGPTWLSCQTQDGVALLDRVLYYSGAELGSTRIVALTRARVPDAAPPVEMLSWSAWTPSEGAGPNDEIVLRDATDPSNIAAEMIVRRRAGITVTIDTNVRRRSFDLRGGGVRLGYGTSPSQTGLVVSRDPIPLVDRAVSLGRHEVVLGRTCAWFDAAPGVSDAGRLECRTQSGMLLKLQTSGRAQPSITLVAVHLRIGQTTAAQMTPPESIFQWLRSESQH